MRSRRMIEYLEEEDDGHEKKKKKIGLKDSYDDGDDDIQVEVVTDDEDSEPVRKNTHSILENPYEYIKPNNYIKYSAMFYSNNQILREHGVRYFRALLAIPNPPIQDLIDCGIIPQLISFIDIAKPPACQFEAAWAITNLVTGTSSQVKYVLDLGVLTRLTSLLTSTNISLLKQVIWAIGNIATNGHWSRDLILAENGLIDQLIQLNSIVVHHNETTFYQRYIWTICTICRVKEIPPCPILSKFLPVMSRCFRPDDLCVIANICLTLSLVMATDERIIDMVIETGIIRDVINLLNGHGEFLSMAIRVVNGVALGSKPTQIQYLIDHGAIVHLAALLYLPHQLVQCDACRAIMNILRGNSKQIQEIIDCDVIFPPLSGQMDWQRDALLGIMNAIENANNEQIQYLMCLEYLPYVVSVFRNFISYPSVVNQVLLGLHQMGLKLQASHPDSFQSFITILVATHIDLLLGELLLDQTDQAGHRIICEKLKVLLDFR